MTAARSDLFLTDVALDLEPGTGDIPLSPLVHSMTARVTDAALTKGVLAILQLGKARMPVEVEMDDAHFVDGGANVTVTAGTGRFLRAKATAVVGITGDGTETIAVEVKEIRALGKLPIESIIGPILEKALDRAATFAGVQRDPSKDRGLLITPNLLLQGQGVPLWFAEPGGWRVHCGLGQLEAVFAVKKAS